MKEQIGETAGKLWSVIGKQKSLPIENVSKVANSDKALAHIALGWLAREDKVEFEAKGKAVFVSLTEKEAEVFKKAHG